MAEAFSKNFIDYEEYPQSAEIQNRCVNMIARLYNAPENHGGDGNAVGTSTIGSSEAIMLAVLALKKRWANKRKAEGKDYSKPNIIMNSAVSEVDFKLPHTSAGPQWTLLLDTNVADGASATPFAFDSVYKVAARSFALLTSADAV